ncbi:hypothetical protein GHT09_015014 [Marmota monax]|uniref:Mitochondrial import receptor subunit TOM40B n=1 Tax=Marmota monax TaxID=9995 RepID=A0A834QAL5_MARMO|nr:hypothetical protein GHT09_015014 [Marmota monax]
MGTLPCRSPRREEPLPNPGSFDEAPAMQRCIPSTDGGSEAHCQQGSEQPFPGGSHCAHECPGLAWLSYAGDWQLSPTEVFPTVVGDMDSSRSLNAQVLLLLAERLEAKACCVWKTAKSLTWQFDGQYRDDYTATLTLGNPDLIGESVIMAAHFLQSLTHGLVLGGELVYHWRPGEEGAILTLAGKYLAVHWVATWNVGSANMLFRGLVDSNWCLGAVLEKMPPLPVTLALGTFLNHWLNRFHCGFSITVG